jgi:hypothetical protein
MTTAHSTESTQGSSSTIDIQTKERRVAELLRSFNLSSDAAVRAVVQYVQRDQHAKASDLRALLAMRGGSSVAKGAYRIGAVVSAEGMVKRLGYSSKSGVHKAKVEDRILAFRLPAGTSDLFPTFQAKKGEVRSWIPRLLAAVGNGFPAVHFLGVPRRSLEGSSYYELLRQEDDPKLIETMLKRAENIGRDSAEARRSENTVAAESQALEPA